MQPLTPSDVVCEMLVIWLFSELSKIDTITTTMECVTPLVASVQMVNVRVQPAACLPTSMQICHILRFMSYGASAVSDRQDGFYRPLC